MLALNVEAIIRQFELQLRRELSPDERHLLRLAFEAYPPCKDDEDDDGGMLAKAGD